MFAFSLSLCPATVQQKHWPPHLVTKKYKHEKGTKLDLKGNSYYQVILQ